MNWDKSTSSDIINNIKILNDKLSLFSIFIKNIKELP